MYETTITMAGKLVSDVSLRNTTSGDKVASFRLYCQERKFQRDTGDWTDGDRMFVTVTCWRRLAEGVAASLAKGDFVLASGRFHIREYRTQDGDPRLSPELEARSVGPDLARCTAMINRQLWQPAPDAPVERETAVAA